MDKLVKIEYLDANGNSTGKTDEFTEYNYKECLKHGFLKNHKIVVDSENEELKPAKAKKIKDNE